MKPQHIHLHEIPKSIVRKGSKALSYRDDLLSTMISFQYSNKKVQHSAQICSYNINQIYTRKGGFIPTRTDVFDSIQEFVYNYENFCYRAYTLREKCLLFINFSLKIGYDEAEVNFKNIKINPSVREAKLISTLNLFNNESPLGKVISDRKRLTHKLYYGHHVDHYLRPLKPTEETAEAKKKYYKSWEEGVKKRAKLANEAAQQLFDLNHDLSEKITSYMVK